MKTSCISHPPKTPLVIIREEYLAICNGDHCEAAVLNQFEYWTNVKLGYQEQAETESKIARAGGIEIPPSDLWIYKTQTELHDELMGLFGIRAIGAALQSLVDRGFLERRNNPKYAWDRTYQYRLETTKVQDAILQLCKIEKSRTQDQKGQESDIESPEDAIALPETTTEIMPKETTEKENAAFPEASEPAPFDAGIDLYWQHCREAEANKEAGRNYAVPAQAGGGDGFLDGPVDAFCEVLAGIGPALLPPKKRKQWAQKLRQIAEEWSTEGAVITAQIVERAIRAVPDDCDIGWKTYKSPFAGKFDEEIGPLLLNGGNPRQKGAPHGSHQRDNRSIAPGAVPRRVASAEEARAILGDKYHGK